MYHLEKGRDIGAFTVTVEEEGPLRASLSIQGQFTKKSSIRQKIQLTAVSKRLDFECHVDWHENRQFLKVEFPFDIDCDYATYETAYGWLVLFFDF